MFRGLRGFSRRHRHSEEVAAEAVGLNLVWAAARWLGLIGAGAAAAAIATTSSATYHPTFALSTKGAAFITRHEGIRLSPYNDPFNCTWGVGSLRHYGRCAASEYNLRLTYAQAMALLVRDASRFTSCVRSKVTHPITQPQFDALVDLTFNAGCGSLDYSGIANEINRAALASVPSTLARTAVTANGVYLSGLHTRRLEEGTLFARGYYGAGIGYYQPAKPKPPVDPKRIPSPVPTWAWQWVAWELGRKPYRGHAGQAAYRPHTAPKRIPAWGWVFLSHFTTGTR
jgi:lysozyme